MPTIVNDDREERLQLGDNIRYLRLRAELTVVGAAALIGVDRTYWHAIERGTANAAMDKYEKIADLFGLSVRDLFKLPRRG